MTELKIPLSVPAASRAAYRKNYELLTNKSGKLLLIAGDQKVEHLNDDFYGNGISPDDKTPEHLFKIAAAFPGGVLAIHPGLLSRYGQNYPQIPYLLKLNGKTNIGGEIEKNSSHLFWNIADIIRFSKNSGLRVVGIGYTVYLGGRYESKMLATAAQAIHDAHQAGLTAVIWMYPRGKNVNEENIHTIAGGAGVAAALDADFVKIKYPYGHKNKKEVAEKFIEAVAAAGRTKVICVGGPKMSVKDLLSFIDLQINVAGTQGLAIGRNLHQRSLSDAAKLGTALGDIIFNHKKAATAYAGYLTKTPPAKSKTSRFLGIF